MNWQQLISNKRLGQEVRHPERHDDRSEFKRDYDRYCMRNGVGRIFPVYQEALMIWLAGTGASQTTWEKYIKMPELIKRFSDYNAMRGNSAFSDTYWYWFDTHKAPEVK